MHGRRRHEQASGSFNHVANKSADIAGNRMTCGEVLMVASRFKNRKLLSAHPAYCNRRLAGTHYQPLTFLLVSGFASNLYL